MAKIKFVLVDFAYDESTDGGIQKLKKKQTKVKTSREFVEKIRLTDSAVPKTIYSSKKTVAISLRLICLPKKKQQKRKDVPHLEDLAVKNVIQLQPFHVLGENRTTSTCIPQIKFVAILPKVYNHSCTVNNWESNHCRHQVFVN